MSKMCLKDKVEGRKRLKNEEAEIEKRRRNLGLISTRSRKGPTDY